MSRKSGCASPFDSTGARLRSGCSERCRTMPPEPPSTSSPVLDVLDVALLVARSLETIGCEYLIGGSVASSLPGEPRATNVIDFIVALSPWRVRAFADALGSDFEVDQGSLREAVSSGRCANIFYLPLVTK